MFRLCLMSILCVACSGRGAEPSPPAQNDTAIHVAPIVLKDAGIRTEAARRAAIAPVVSLPGEVAADPDRLAVVTTPVAGRLASISFKEGDRVKRGEVIARITVTEISRIQTARNIALAKATAARADAARLKLLVDQALRPEQALLDARAAAESAEAEARGLADQLRILGAGASSSELPLLAPRDGVVVTRSALVGARCDVTDVIATVADLSAALFVARAFEGDLSRIAVGANATVSLDALQADLKGTVEAIGDKLDPLNRATPVRIRISDPRLKIGLFGLARVATNEAPTTALLSVPRSAIADIAGRKVVFVRSGAGFLPREVVLGIGDRERIAIITGITEGDEVVVEGVFSLKSIVLRTTLSEG